MRGVWGSVCGGGREARPRGEEATREPMAAAVGRVVCVEAPYALPLEDGQEVAMRSWFKEHDPNSTPHRRPEVGCRRANAGLVRPGQVGRVGCRPWRKP